jgi:hypothetical protein
MLKERTGARLHMAFAGRILGLTFAFMVTTMTVGTIRLYSALLFSKACDAHAAAVELPPTVPSPGAFIVVQDFTVSVVRSPMPAGTL